MSLQRPGVALADAERQVPLKASRTLGVVVADDTAADGAVVALPF
ncbi:MAG: hypothetical protein ABMA15_25365 [Vicinamibacterales bacterium]